MPSRCYWLSACRGWHSTGPPSEYVPILNRRIPEKKEKKKTVVPICSARVPYLFSCPPWFDLSEFLQAMADQDEIRGNSVYETAESGVEKPVAHEKPKPKSGFMGKSVFPLRMVSCA